MPLARLHSDALDGVATAGVPRQQRHCSRVHPPDSPWRKPDFAEPCAHLLREVTA